jgi:hypothetical protein
MTPRRSGFSFSLLTLAFFLAALASGQSISAAEGHWLAAHRGKGFPNHAPTQATGPFNLLNPVIYPIAGFGADSVAVADLNGDGKLDMVVANACQSVSKQGYCLGDGQISVMLGNGDGTFQNPITYDSGGYMAVSVAIADLTGNGIPDIVVANQCLKPFDHYGQYWCSGYSANGIISVFLGNGDGTFQSPVTYSSVGLVAGSVAIGDLNRDGIPDLVVADACVNFACASPGGAVSVLLGNGDGTFQKAVEYPSGGSDAFYAAVADLRGDGILDIVVGNFCEAPDNCDVGSIGVLLGNGDGTFQPAIAYVPGGQMGVVAIGDVNGDGIPDLVTTTGFDSRCAGASDETCLDVMLGNGDGTFQWPTTFDWGGYWYSSALVIADMNGDGIPDLVMNACVGLFCAADEAQIGVLLGNGDGTFQVPVTYSTGIEYSATSSIAVGDVNGDGLPDVLAAITGNETEKIKAAAAVLLNNTGAPATTISLVPSVNPVPLGSQVTYTAIVSSQTGGTAAGTVTFMDWSISFDSVTVPLVNNQATFTTEYNSQVDAPELVAAFYSGVLQQEASSTSGILDEYICSPTTMSLHGSHSPSKLGKPVTFRAAISSHGKGKPLNGEPVSFYDGSNLLGSAPLKNEIAVYVTSGLSQGTHVITAVYQTDDYYCQSSAQLTHLVE